MALELRPAVASDRDAWTAFLAERAEGDILQSWAWGEAGSGEPGERWTRLAVTGDGGRIRGIAQVLDRATSFGRSILYVPHGPVWEREAPPRPHGVLAYRRSSTIVPEGTTMRDRRST